MCNDARGCPGAAKKERYGVVKMNSMERLQVQLKRHEGFRRHPYRCPAGKLTIGYGRNLDENGISRAEAGELLSNDLSYAFDDVAALVGEDIFWRMVGASPARLAVLANMAYNMGRATLSQFQHMLAAVEDSDWERAAEEMLDSRWAHQVGDRATELAAQMRTGEWQDAGGE